MASELVNLATSEKLKEIDWTKSIEICELVSRDHGKAKEIIKSIKKRLGNKNSNTQLFTVMLLEMLMNNCGEHVHKQVIDNGLLSMLVKMVKKKGNEPVRERIFLLLDATQTSLGGASGKFPQYYAAYYDLVAYLQSAGVKFAERPRVPPPDHHGPEGLNGVHTAPKSEVPVAKSTGQVVPDSSIIQKATSVLDVLKDVLNALDPKNPERRKWRRLGLPERMPRSREDAQEMMKRCKRAGATGKEIKLALMQDERLVSQAIELNEQLQKILDKHDALLSVRGVSTTSSTVDNGEREEEEDADRLLRRLQKGKACAEDHSDSFSGSFRSQNELQKPRRPLNRPLCIEPSDTNGAPPPPPPPPVAIPPPPAKRIERERFFKEKQVDGSALSGHVRGLSLHSRNGSSSRGGSCDFSE
ncbi:hypothetical protein QJS10_CPB19g00047 [Acorus calamus]|uniref:VHS domain-containing protein n=1 Tax=Acorus calamus TaxID=4465 RepID=A0AAV9CGZ8_ACOCL|nr:hypothetical protein QJS10_CPB19g00047 [Acorus calamus]